MEKDPLLKQPASKNDVMEAIVRNDSELRVDKNSLTIYVPYRLLSSFLDEVSGSDHVWDSQKRIIAYFEILRLFYDLSEGSKLHFGFDLDRGIFFVERYQLNIIFVLLIFFYISVTVQIEGIR